MDKTKEQTGDYKEEYLRQGIQLLQMEMYALNLRHDALQAQLPLSQKELADFLDKKEKADPLDKKEKADPLDKKENSVRTLKP